MPATLVATGLSAGHGARPLFTGLDLVVAPGDVLGLVGANGAGKSTLLRLLAGLDPAEGGTVALNPPDAVVGHVAQETEPVVDPATDRVETVLAHLSRRTGVTAAEQALTAATESLAVGEPGAEESYATALERWLTLGGSDLADRAPQTLAELGLHDSGPHGVLSRTLAELSGGQAARARLAAVLLSRFDVLLLDEPTNDLDLDGLARLEQFVGELRTGCVVVSHDREFLARCVTGVVELDLAQQQVAIYGGSYGSYLIERARARHQAREAYEDYARTHADLEARARRQRGWAEVGVRRAMRRRPDNDKIGARFRAETSEKTAAKARQTERRIERLDTVEEPRKEWELRYAIAAAPRGSAVVATLDGAVVRRDAFTLGPVDLQLDAGDRVAVTGANGAGKSTLLAALLGRVPLDAGRRSFGASVAVGEVDQARRLLDRDDGTTLLDAVRAELPQETPSDVRSLLATFGLGADHVLRSLASLSPGERTRAALALLQARGINLLVLDEPTNHLDLPAIEQLESALAGYRGTLLLVTHDRRMLEAVAVTRHWHVVDGAVREEPGP